MPLKPFVKVVGNLLSKKNAITSVPMSFLLVGLQALINVHFSCPCIYAWNITLSIFVLVVPAFFAFVIMLMLLKPWKYKHIHTARSGCQKSKCGGSSMKNENNKGSQEQEKKVQNESKETWSQTKESCEWVLLACLIPPVVWICIYFIDGDYVACAASNWNGRYACDKELHPVCLNWCKPNEEQNETEKYEKTLEAIRASKICGYVIALVCCIVAMGCVVHWNDCCCSASESPESKGDGEETHDLLRKPEKKQGEEHEMDQFQDEDSTKRHPNQDDKTE
ncbi:uncharacterized protein LOC130216276 [Danio aesculapii]|uniref:uncharacterized protein LOC130216276 n=1 Tax=Danio aesculapii TaxID=1142201 RepID=UPI0024C072A2|nr:uncharacterized protein LOC130216276 [Danio aesculapii]